MRGISREYVRFEGTAVLSSIVRLVRLRACRVVGGQGVVVCVDMVAR